jgi:predicted nucleic acid-binding protein
MVTAPPVIIDTNVVIAGLPTVNGPGTFAAILDGMLGAAFPFVVSGALLAEYRAVLGRPSLLARLRLSIDQVDALVTRIAGCAIELATVPAPRAPDPGDQLLWELLAAQAELKLVTRDKLLLRNGKMRGRVIGPEAFLTGGRVLR